MDPCRWEACGHADKSKKMKMVRSHAAQESDGDRERSHELESTGSVQKMETKNNLVRTVEED